MLATENVGYDTRCAVVWITTRFVVSVIFIQLIFGYFWMSFVIQSGKPVTFYPWQFLMSGATRFLLIICRPPRRIVKHVSVSMSVCALGILQNCSYDGCFGCCWQFEQAQTSEDRKMSKRLWVLISVLFCYFPCLFFDILISLCSFFCVTCPLFQFDSPCIADLA